MQNLRYNVHYICKASCIHISTRSSCWCTQFHLSNSSDSNIFILSSISLHVCVINTYTLCFHGINNLSRGLGSQAFIRKHCVLFSITYKINNGFVFPRKKTETDKKMLQIKIGVVIHRQTWNHILTSKICHYSRYFEFEMFKGVNTMDMVLDKSKFHNILLLFLPETFVVGWIHNVCIFYEWERFTINFFLLWIQLFLMTKVKREII